MRSSRPSTRTPRSARASASPLWPPKAVRYTSHRSSPRGQGSPVTAALTGPDNRGQWPDGWPGHHIRPPAISGHPPHQATHHIRPLATSSRPATISGHPPYHQAPPPHQPPPPPPPAPPPHPPPPPSQPTRHIIKPRHHIRPPATGHPQGVALLYTVRMRLCEPRWPGKSPASHPFARQASERGNGIETMGRGRIRAYIVGPALAAGLVGGCTGGGMAALVGG